MRYRLLIVDDEPYILDWLVGLFLIQQDDALSVYRAADAEEALVLMQRHRIDVVLSDIMMPGLDGMEFSRQVLQRWPACKFIFLTAYDRFDYIYTAMDSGIIDYVLKTESDERILGAVDKAVQMIEKERASLSRIQQAEEKLGTMQPLLQNTLLNAVFRNSAAGGPQLAGQFAELGIPLDPAREVRLLLLRVDSSTIGDATDILGGIKEYTYIDSILSRRLAPHFHAASFVAENIADDNERRHICALVQPQVAGEGGARQYLNQMLEDVSGTIAAALDIQVSLCCAQRDVPLSGIRGQYDILRTILDIHMNETGVILTDGQPEIDRLGAIATGKGITSELYQFQQHLLSGNGGYCTGLIDRFRACGEDEREQFYSATLVVLEIIAARYGILPDSVRMDYGAFPAGDDAMDHLSALTQRLCTAIADAGRSEEQTAVERIRDYIARNLGGDLSLDTMAEALHYNPSYLSRLFHGNTGVTISQYISSVRLTRIKELLADRSLKIKDIAEATGFDSPSYFARYFKKETGMTAQVWRDKNG